MRLSVLAIRCNTARGTKYPNLVSIRYRFLSARKNIPLRIPKGIFFARDKLQTRKEKPPL
jgi:hypothetical protein